MDTGPYKTTDDVKATFSMTDSSSRNFTMHLFHIDKAWGDEGIFYDVIIDCDTMVQLVMKSEFWIQVLEWDNTVVPMKETGKFLGQPGLTKRDIR